MLADAPTLGLADVGSEGTLAFYGAEGTVLLTVPVPEGLVPAELTAVVEIPVNMRHRHVDRRARRSHASLERCCPNTDQVPITIPLSGVSVVDNAITVILRSYLVPIEGYCLDPANPLRLINARHSLRRHRDSPRTGRRLPAADIGAAHHLPSAYAIACRIRCGDSAVHRGGCALWQTEPRVASSRWTTGRPRPRLRRCHCSARSSSARARAVAFHWAAMSASHRC